MTADTTGYLELEGSLDEALRDPAFARIYWQVVRALDRAAAARPGPLCVDGREYSRRRQARRRRGR